MEISRLQMREIVTLAQTAGPSALKGLKDLQRRAIAVMAQALKNNQDQAKVKGLDEHEFAELKDYLAKQAALREEGRMSTPLPSRPIHTLIKGIKNIAGTRISSSRLDREIDRAIEALQPGATRTKFLRIVDEQRRTIAGAEKRLESIEKEQDIQERTEMRNFWKKLLTKKDMVGSLEAQKGEARHLLLLHLKDAAYDLVRMNHPDSDLIEAAVQELNGEKKLSVGFVKDIALVLKNFPEQARKFALLQDFAEQLDQVSRAKQGDGRLLIKEALDEQQKVLMAANQETADLRRTIKQSQSALEKLVDQLKGLRKA